MTVHFSLAVRSLATEQLATSTTESIPDPTPVVCPTPADSGESSKWH